jgi:chromosome segregation ATPase
VSEVATDEGTLSAAAKRLLIPTNPHVSPDVDPSTSGDFEYTNPVALNNRVVLYANALIECTDLIVQYQNRLEGAKLEKRTAERQIEDFEGRLLRQHPTPKGHNTLKALQAHIEKTAFEVDDTGDQYHDLREALRKAEDKVAKWQSKLSGQRDWLEAIKLASQNVGYHLSYVKFDSHLSGRAR